MAADIELKKQKPIGAFIEVLRWHDEQAKDYLIVKEKHDRNEVMNARAKGVTPYELIALYGSVDNVAAAFPENGAFYGDASGIPEYVDSRFIEKLAELQATIDDIKKQAIGDEVPPVEKEKPVESEDK